MRDVSKELHVGMVDSAELIELLTFAIGHAEFTSRTRIDLPDSNEPTVVLYFTRKGRLQRVESNLEASRIQGFSSEIRGALMSDLGVRFGRQILFSKVPCVGGWAGGHLSILPVPTNAPRPSQVVGYHPFVLEVPFFASSNWRVNALRIKRAISDWSLVLEVLGPFMNAMPTIHGVWAVDLNHAIDEGLRPKTVQSLYWFEGFEGVVDSPTEPTESLMKVSDVEYYSRRGYFAGQVLDLPVGMEARTNQYANLTESQKIQFLRCAYWLRHSNLVYQTSRSAALMSSVQAIESLIEKKWNKVPPDESSVRKPGPTELFIKFLKTYAPSIKDSSEGLREQLYNARSRLSHGENLLSLDRELGMSAANPIGSVEYQQLGDASTLVRTAALNWLMDHGKKPSEETVVLRGGPDHVKGRKISSIRISGK